VGVGFAPRAARDVSARGRASTADHTEGAPAALSATLGVGGLGAHRLPARHSDARTAREWAPCPLCTASERRLIRPSLVARRGSHPPAIRQEYSVDRSRPVTWSHFRGDAYSLDSSPDSHEYAQ
jgi:hypothetical protein